MRSLAVALLLGLSAVRADAATMLVYGVKEDGGEYPSRLIITEQFLRMDGGGGADDGFVLFDRKEGVIYNVTHGDRTILVIPARPLPQPPMKIVTQTISVEADAGAPTVGGRVPEHRRLLVNSKPCHDVIAANDLLPEAVAVLREFNSVLAGQKGGAVETIPADMLDGCDLAMNVFHPNWVLEFGLPIRQWGAGRTEMLLDFDPDFAASPRLFLLPPDYERFGGEEKTMGQD